MGVAPDAHLITHVVTIQAALIGPILCSIAASLTSVRKRRGHIALDHMLPLTLLGRLQHTIHRKGPALANKTATRG